jgi:ribosomal 30S subunit maturation factor RimM
MEWVELGRIGSPYGVLGWMHVQSFTDPLEGILDYPVWSLRLGSGAQTGYRLVEGRIQGRGLVARLEGVTDREAAAVLRGAMIEELGRLDHFVEGPGTTMMVVAGTAEYWIPAIPQYLRKVDLEGRGLSVDWPADAD